MNVLFSIYRVLHTVDNVRPEITCPTVQDQLVRTAGANGAFVSWSVPTASDNSGINPTVELFPSSQQASGTVFPFGSYSITYRATDAAGNTATCAVTFNVCKLILPRPICNYVIKKSHPFNSNSKLKFYCNQKWF